MQERTANESEEWRFASRFEVLTCTRFEQLNLTRSLA